MALMVMSRSPEIHRPVLHVPSGQPSPFLHCGLLGSGLACAGTRHQHTLLKGNTINKTRQELRRLHPRGWLLTASVCGLTRALGEQWRGRAISTVLITRCFVCVSSGSLFSLLARLTVPSSHSQKAHTAPYPPARGFWHLLS